MPNPKFRSLIWNLGFGYWNFLLLFSHAGQPFRDVIAVFELLFYMYIVGWDLLDQPFVYSIALLYLQGSLLHAGVVVLEVLAVRLCAGFQVYNTYTNTAALICKLCRAGKSAWFKSVQHQHNIAGRRIIQLVDGEQCTAGHSVLQHTAIKFSHLSVAVFCYCFREGIGMVSDVGADRIQFFSGQVNIRLGDVWF